MRSTVSTRCIWRPRRRRHLVKLLTWLPSGAVQMQVPSLQMRFHGAATMEVNENSVPVAPGSTVTISGNGAISILEPHAPARDRLARARRLRAHGQGGSPACTFGGECEPDNPNNPTDDDLNIGQASHDPSGYVETTTGIPLAGAKVLLWRATTRQGPFARVPNGSVIMSPGNRRNPDRTNTLGHFGWDVIYGDYFVTASHPGCTAPPPGKHPHTSANAARARKPGRNVATTRVYQVPPPVDNLLIRLRCPGLSRARSRITITVRKLRHDHNALLVTATLHGERAHRPTGLLTIKAPGTNQTIPITPRTEQATVVIPRRAGVITVHYLGDAYNQPSRAHAAPNRKR